MERQDEFTDRELPVIDIAGMKFYVDAEQYLMIDVQDHNNIIRGNDFLWVDNHIEFLFDKETRNIKPRDWQLRDEGRHEYIWLHPLEVYDQNGAANRLGYDGQLIPPDLPVIDIEGVPFLWDRSGSRLLQQDVPWNQIAKNDMQKYEEGTGFYFDTELKVVPFPHELEQMRMAGHLPAHVRFVHQQDIVRKINEQEQLRQTSRKGYRIR